MQTSADRRSNVTTPSGFAKHGRPRENTFHKLDNSRGVYGFLRLGNIFNGGGGHLGVVLARCMRVLQVMTLA